MEKRYSQFPHDVYSHARAHSYFSTPSHSDHYRARPHIASRISKHYETLTLTPSDSPTLLHYATHTHTHAHTHRHIHTYTHTHTHTPMHAHAQSQASHSRTQGVENEHEDIHHRIRIIRRRREVLRLEGGDVHAEEALKHDVSRCHRRQRLHVCVCVQHMPRQEAIVGSSIRPAPYTDILSVAVCTQVQLSVCCSPNAACNYFFVLM
jgi:hypothetical protein